MRVRGLSWLLVSLWVAATAPAADFTMARNDIARTGYTAEKLSPPLSLLWQFSTAPDNSMSATPICVGKRVYFCSLGVVYCLDAETGEQIWSYETRFAIRSTPVFHSGRLFVTTANGEMHVLDAADKPEKPLLTKLEIRGGLSSDPVLTKDIMYLVTDNGKLYRVNLESFAAEELNKNSPFQAGPNRSVAYDGRRLVFTGTDNLVYCFDLNLKRRLWSQVQGVLVTPPVLTSETATVVTREGVRSLKTRSGTLDWQRRGLISARGAAALANNRLYVAARDEFLYMLDPVRGTVLGRSETDSMVEAAPTVADKEVYLGTMAGNVYCLDAENLKAKWYYRCNPVETVGGKDTKRYAVCVPPVVANGNVLAVTNQGTLYCFRADAVDLGRPRLYLPQLATNAVDGSMVAKPINDDKLREAMVEDAKAAAKASGDPKKIEKPDIPTEAEMLALPGKQRVFRFETYAYDEGSGVDLSRMKVLWDGKPYTGTMNVTPNDLLLTVDLITQKAGLARAQLDDGEHTLMLIVPDFRATDEDLKKILAEAPKVQDPDSYHNILVRTFTFKIDNALPPLEPVKKKTTGPDLGPGGPPGGPGGPGMPPGAPPGAPPR